MEKLESAATFKKFEKIISNIIKDTLKHKPKDNKEFWQKFDIEFNSWFEALLELANELQNNDVFRVRLTNYLYDKINFAK